MKRIAIVILGIIAVLGLVIFEVGQWLDYDQMSTCGGAPTGNNECRAADVIVAISGGDTNARAQKAIDLYKAGFAKNIIFSGAAADPKSPSNAAAMRKIALKNGVADGAITLDETSRNTNENAANVAKILRARGWTNVILVSENYHLRRAYTDFVRANTEADFRAISAKNQPFWWATPRGWYLIISEIGGMTKNSLSNN